MFVEIFVIFFAIIDSEEKERVLKDPLSYLLDKSPPHDINVVPEIFIIGKPLCGKSSLARRMEEELGIIY